MIRSDVLIARTPLRHGEEVRVTLSPYRGQVYAHCRRCYEHNGVWRPGKGLALHADLLPWLRAAIAVAEEAAVREGLLEREDYEAHDLRVPLELDRPA